MSGLRKYLGQGPPQTHGSVADDELGIAHAAPAAVPQEVGPGLGRLAQALGERLFTAVGAHAHEDQDTGAGLAEADLGVDAFNEIDQPSVRQHRN